MTSELPRDELLAALDHERAALLALLPRFDEQRWHGAVRADGWSAHDIACHVADSTYGLARLVTGELAPVLPLTDTGWMNADELNEQRRQKNAGLPREKVLSRTASAFDHARRAIQSTDDFDAPGPYGPVHTRRMWLNRIVDHARAHRQELEELLG
jgi:hypothetical protein